MTRSRILPILGALALAGSQSAMAASPNNPEADFVARLGGKTYTVERTEGGASQRGNPGAEAASARIIGNPLRNRAETLAGKAFTVENAEGKALKRKIPAMKPQASGPSAIRCATGLKLWRASPSQSKEPDAGPKPTCLGLTSPALSEAFRVGCNSFACAGLTAHANDIANDGRIA